MQSNIERRTNELLELASTMERRDKFEARLFTGTIGICIFLLALLGYGLTIVA